MHYKILVDGRETDVEIEGELIIKDGKSTIKKHDNALLRHIIKTITYRLFGTATTILVAYLLGASIKVASLIGVSELVFKPIMYFFHERIWYKYIKIK